MKQNTTGGRIKEIRTQRGISVQQLSQALDKAVVRLSEQELRDIEEFGRKIYDIELLAIAQALDCTIGELYE